MKVRPIDVFEFAKKIEGDILSRDVLSKGIEYEKIKTNMDVKSFLETGRGFLYPRDIHNLIYIEFKDIELYKDKNTSLTSQIKHNYGKNAVAIPFNERMDLSCISYDYSDSKGKVLNNYNLIVNLRDRYFEREYQFTFIFKDLMKFIKNGLSEISESDILFCSLRIEDVNKSIDNSLVTSIPININDTIEINKEVEGYNRHHLVLMIKPSSKEELEKVNQATELNRVGKNIADKYKTKQNININK